MGGRIWQIAGLRGVVQKGSPLRKAVQQARAKVSSCIQEKDGACWLFLTSRLRLRCKKFRNSPLGKETRGYRQVYQKISALFIGMFIGTYLLVSSESPLLCLR